MVEDGAGGELTNEGPANDDGPKNGGGPMNGGPKNGGELANGGGPMNGGGPANDDGRTVGEGEDGSAATIDVLSLAAPPDPEHPRGRPAVKRLMVGDGANLIAFTFAPGQSFPDHSVAHPITVQCLSGELTFG